MNKICDLKISVLLLTLWTVTVFADSNTTSPVTSQTIQSTPIEYTLSELTPSFYAKLNTDQQKTIADAWHLSVADYAHYLWLMTHTPNSIYYQDRHLDPSWILGFNANSEQERQKFVVIAIQNERERIAKELAFQQDFMRLQQQLYPDQKPVVWVNDTDQPKNSNSSQK